MRIKLGNYVVQYHGTASIIFILEILKMDVTDVEEIDSTNEHL